LCPLIARVRHAVVASGRSGHNGQPSRWTCQRVTDDASRIWVDADACPGAIKDILFRAAERTRVRVTLVANQWLRTPPSRFIDAIQVPGGFDMADTAIVERVRAGDLVV